MTTPSTTAGLPPTPFTECGELKISPLPFPKAQREFPEALPREYVAYWTDGAASLPVVYWGSQSPEQALEKATFFCEEMGVIGGWVEICRVERETEA